MLARAAHIRIPSIWIDFCKLQGGNFNAKMYWELMEGSCSVSLVHIWFIFKVCQLCVRCVFFAMKLVFSPHFSPSVWAFGPLNWTTILIIPFKKVGKCAWLWRRREGGYRGYRWLKTTQCADPSPGISLWFLNLGYSNQADSKLWKRALCMCSNGSKLLIRFRLLAGVPPLWTNI